ncbi:MAG TPA: ATP-dependent DNA helicase RecG [Candidatus Paceibacterota bacterium]|nr:ATP-dependent DNA helicase RecG [Candidatus Paceibacterota bacterium]
MRRLSPETPLFEALGAKSPYVRRLEHLGLATVGDLLRHFPARYEDFSKIYKIAELEPGQAATIQAAVEDVRVRRTRRGMTIVEATLADEDGTIRAVWFNQPYVATTLRPGRVANFAGKISVSDENELYLNHPAYEIVRPDVQDRNIETRHTARLVPIYPETRGLTSRGIRFVMQSIMRRAQPSKEWLPEETLAALGLPEVNRALRAVHFPLSMEHAAAARRRFDFESIFLLHLWNLQQKLRLADAKASSIAADIGKIRRILAELPFDLTQSQKRSLWEVVQDMEKPRPMNRLLQGDVGSGKTIVAAIAAIIAAENERQTAFMAPTEILARQHFQTMAGLLHRIAAQAKPVIGLLTAGEALVFYEDGMETKVTKDEFRKRSAKGGIAIIFGTHALIQKNVSFKDLALVVIDEQHRFGVRQRQALASIATGGRTPHLLSMSATPIPRTLMFTVFGDLNLSLITELPAGRKAIETKIVLPLERQATYELIRREIGNGRQAFVICPRIEKSDEPDMKDGGAQKNWDVRSVVEEYEKLSKRIFPDLRVAMLHGQMKAKEKEDIMRRFRDGKIDLLVSTSVVEVGVDIPNATIMMIEGTDRFGLAQLYQFRGRVGRGEHQSYCFLFTDSTAEPTQARLKAILTAKNGFELAEEDLKLRGPGQFFGDIQTGFPDAAMTALQDAELVRSSREAAVAVLAKDPSLQTHPALKKKFEEFKKTIHRE